MRTFLGNPPMLAFEFVSAVIGAIAVTAPVMRNLGDIAKGGNEFLHFVDNIWGRFFKKGDKARPQVEVRQTMEEIAAMPQKEFEKKVEQIVDSAPEFKDKPPEYKASAADYIKRIKTEVNFGFSRPEDPTGATVPAHWAIGRPEEVAKVLPPRFSQIQAGMSPPQAPGWVLTEQLGIGGFGEVWKARGTRMTSTLSAFKFCLDPVSRDRILAHELENIELVQNELHDDPHIVNLYEAYIEPDAETPWLRFQYVPGGELGGLVATWPDQLEARATNAVHTIGILATTLGKCHLELSKIVVHRDMKPANVLVGPKGTLKITDFGIGSTQARKAIEEAMIPGSSSMSPSTLTFLPQVKWARTPIYASPQQRKGLDPHPADDVHALGVMLYQMLKNNLNLELGIDMWQDLEKKYVCKELLEVLYKSVASEADRRFQNGFELAEALKGLPEKLVAKPVAVSVADIKKKLHADITEQYSDADTKNATARQQLDRREWAAAVTTLESIFHERMRDRDLYLRATQHRDGTRFINGIGMEFIRIPNGTFWMGGKDGNCGDNQVKIDRDFFIGVYPVTQEEWQKVMGTNPSAFRKGGSGADTLTGVPDGDLKRFPVESISWNDCQVFIKKLNESMKETGWMYRLPREAEWEYACRGAATTRELCSWNFYFESPTNTLSAQQANFSDSALERTTRVGLYEPNSLGIFDAHGNVWEWCEDVYDSSGPSRVIRGGSWYYYAEVCAAAYRYRSEPSLATNFLGLRLARVPSGSK